MPKPRITKDEVLKVIALSNLWLDSVVRPDKEVISVMDEWKVTTKDLEKLMLSLGISTDTLWKHNRDLA